MKGIGKELTYLVGSCTGCHLCELVCSFVHFKKSSINLARIRIFKDKSKAIFIPLVCVSCPGKPCVNACPNNALVMDEKTGMPKVIVDKCKGVECMKCAEVCPYNAVFFEPSLYPYPLICDLCGGDPMCLKVCWSRALSIVEMTLRNDPERLKIAAANISRYKEIRGVK